MSAHSLEIEKGRWNRKLVNGKWVSAKVPEHERICLHCDENQVENELHVMMQCPLYSDTRNHLFTIARQTFPEFDNIDPKSKFKLLLTSKEQTIVQETAKFTSSMFTKRTEHADLMNNASIDSSE